MRFSALLQQPCLREHLRCMMRTPATCLHERDDLTFHGGRCASITWEINTEEGWGAPAQDPPPQPAPGAVPGAPEW